MLQRDYCYPGHTTQFSQWYKEFWILPHLTAVADHETPTDGAIAKFSSSFLAGLLKGALGFITRRDLIAGLHVGHS